jgi:uncharacterized protein DUF4381
MPPLNSSPQAAPQQMSDPLAQLRDIHLPDAVSAWPPAPGWWLLAALLLTLAVWGSYRLRQQYRRNAYRRQAQQELSMLESDNALTRAQTIARLNALLKRIALHAYPKSDTASLSGSDWIKFLNSSCPSLKQNQDRICFEIFQTGPYQTEITEDMFDRSSLFADCSQWILQHLKATDLTVEAV